MRLEGTTAIVTGGASGLGQATARALARAGARVGIMDLDADRGRALADELHGAFARVDIADEASVDAGFAAVRAEVGQERILVNCAGRGNSIKTASRDRDTGEIKRFSADAFAAVIAVNVVGTFRCITAAAAGMMTLDALEDGERGVIVSTASIAAEDGQMGQAAYASSKAAIVGLTLPVARDLMKEGIRVNAILPGIFDTPLFNGVKPAVKEALAASVPHPRRLGDPAEFASLALEICRNPYINAATYRLDGALRMAAR